MIRKIGIICQDANSIGFLQGLQQRLGCVADIVEPPAAVGRSVYMSRRQALIAWKYFERQGVDLVVRFTDADLNRWQDVRREEPKAFSDAVQSILVCGVAVPNTERWLGLDLGYVATCLRMTEAELADENMQTDRIKAGLIAIRQMEEDSRDVVARIVAEAPPAVFRRWLQNDSLRTFYTDCRNAALQSECQVPNELEKAD